MGVGVGVRHTCTENRVWAGVKDRVEFVAGSRVPALQEHIYSKHFGSSPSSSAWRPHQLRKFHFWKWPQAGASSKSQLQKFRFRNS